MKSSQALIVAAFALLASSTALAQPPSAETRARAKEAYDKGVEAHNRGDMNRAAHEFARADSIAPSPVALQAALDAAIEADDPGLGAELLERSGREKPTKQLATSIETAKTKFAGRAGRLRVQCPAATPCLATLDGQSIETTKPVWARTGQHTVVVTVEGDVQTKLVSVEPNQIAEVTATRKDAAAAPASTSPTTAPAGTEATPDQPKRQSLRDRYRDGLPPIFFYGGAGATLLLAGITTYFAVDTSNKHGEFTSLGCDRANYLDCEAIKDDGEGSQTATNVGLVLTGIVGIATAVVGFKFTNWNGPLVAVTPGGGSVLLARKF